MMNLILKIEKKVTEDWLRKFDKLLDSLHLLAGMNRQRIPQADAENNQAIKDNNLIERKKPFFDK